MKWKDKYHFVKQNMKKNKSRLFMTILATAMGCCFLVVLASIGFGFQKSLTEQITSYGKITEISIYGKTNQPESSNYASSLYSMEQVSFFQGFPQVEAVGRQNAVELTSKYAIGDYVAEVDRAPVFTFMETEKNGKLELAEGRFPENEHEIIVGFSFGEILHPPSKPEQAYQGSLLNQ